MILPQEDESVLSAPQEDESGGGGREEQGREGRRGKVERLLGFSRVCWGLVFLSTAEVLDLFWRVGRPIS